MIGKQPWQETIMRDGASREELLPITVPYLICLNIVCYRDARGIHYFDPLWHKDLMEHLRYLKNLTLACPCRLGEPPPDAVALDIPVIELPCADSVGQFIRWMPATALRLWKAIRAARIVHLGVAGWPVPLGWLASPMALLRRRPSVIVVESAPWRLRPGLPVTLKKRLRAGVSEVLSQWCLKRAAVVIVTQAEYWPRGHVIPASWVDADTILSRTDAEEAWRSKKLDRRGPLKLLFAGRLEHAKGVPILLDAMRLLSLNGAPVELDILGQGPLLRECEEASRDLTGAAKIRMLGTVPYDAGFFRIVREHHAVVVPSLSDEQPRIVYDAFSQAVPVLASDTPGLRACVQRHKTGKIALSNKPVSWAALFKSSLRHPHELEAMGIASLEIARGLTHEEMHRRRWQLLSSAFQNTLDPAP